MNHCVTIAVRWAARITGLLLVGLVVLMMIGEGGPPNILTQPFPVQVESVGMLLMLVGFLVGWRWRAIGGISAVTGFLLFLGTEFAVNGRPPGGAIPLFVIPGILLLISAGLETYQRRVGKDADLTTA